MTVIKNRDVPEGKEFWDHVENVAANFQPPEIKSDSIGGRGMMTAEQFYDDVWQGDNGCHIWPVFKDACAFAEAYHRAEAAAQLAEKDRILTEMGGYEAGLREKVAEKEREIARLTKQLINCGGDNCFGQTIDGCRTWVSKERLEKEQARAEAAEQRLQEAQAANQAARVEAEEIAKSVSRYRIDGESLVDSIGNMHNTIALLEKERDDVNEELGQREAELEQAVMCMDRSCKRCNAALPSPPKVQP